MIMTKLTSGFRWSTCTKNYSDDQFVSEHIIWRLFNYIPNEGHHSLVDCIYTKSFMEADLIWTHILWQKATNTFPLRDKEYPRNVP